MSDPALRLPERPSMEQLRKQAKDRLRAMRAQQPDATLSAAQLTLARDYGFDSWPKLVHHVEYTYSVERVKLYAGLAQDILSGYGGDDAALERIGAWFGDSYNNAQRLERVRDRVNGLQPRSDPPTLDDTRLVLARQYGFTTWEALVESLSAPAGGGAPKTTPPFYRINEEKNTLEPRGPLTDRDWDTVFGVMEDRGITGIVTSAMTDRALQRLAHLDFVKRVNVGGARGVSDDGLLHLARMPQLEELDLSGWHSNWTDRGLECLRHLPALKRLQMCWPQRVTDAGVAWLSYCDQLERVDLMGTQTGDGVINALRGKRSLGVFKTGRLVTDRGIPLLRDFPVFTAPPVATPEFGLMSFGLDANALMIDGPFTDAGIAELAGLDGLMSLNFFWHSKAFTGAGLASLKSLPNLIHLGCDGERCDDDGFRGIAQIPRLRVLMGQGAVASDEGWIALSRAPALEYIWGRDCPNFGSRGFRALANLKSLIGMGISCKRVDDAALATLPAFPALRQLMPMDVPDDGFHHVGRCTSLVDLWCMYCRDTGDTATGHIAGLSLKSYYAGKTKITDRSLEILSRMTTLEKIELWETAGVTDAGIAALARLPNLRELSVDATNVTRAGLAVLPPAVKVNR